MWRSMCDASHISDGQKMDGPNTSGAILQI